MRSTVEIKTYLCQNFGQEVDINPVQSRPIFSKEDGHFIREGLIEKKKKS